MYFMNLILVHTACAEWLLIILAVESIVIIVLNALLGHFIKIQILY